MLVKKSNARENKPMFRLVSPDVIDAELEVQSVLLHMNRSRSKKSR